MFGLWGLTNRVSVHQKQAAGPAHWKAVAKHHHRFAAHIGWPSWVHPQPSINEAIGPSDYPEHRDEAEHQVI